MGFDISLNTFQRREPDSLLPRCADPRWEVHQLQSDCIPNKRDLHLPLWSGVDLFGEHKAAASVWNCGVCGENSRQSVTSDHVAAQHFIIPSFNHNCRYRDYFMKWWCLFRWWRTAWTSTRPACTPRSSLMSWKMTTTTCWSAASSLGWCLPRWSQRDWPRWNCWTVPGGRAAVTERRGWGWRLRTVLAEDLRPSRAVGFCQKFQLEWLQWLQTSCVFTGKYLRGELLVLPVKKWKRNDQETPYCNDFHISHTSLRSQLKP